MIIIGYPGIGKTTLASRKQGYIDLETSHFWISGERPAGWETIYARIAEDLSAQGNIVFSAGHEAIQSYLSRTQEKIVVICPSIELSEEWIVKLADRFKHTGLDKDFKAWLRAQENIKDDIEAFHKTPFDIYEINDMNYNLVEIIENL